MSSKTSRQILNGIRISTVQSLNRSLVQDITKSNDALNTLNNDVSVIIVNEINAALILAVKTIMDKSMDRTIADFYKQKGKTI